MNEITIPQAFEQMIIILGFLMGAGIMKMFVFKRLHVPWLEMYYSNAPIAWILSGGEIKLHTIRSKGKYFVVNDKRLRGIFVKNNKYRYMIEKTACYFYAVNESNNIDPVMINELNRWKERNALSVVRHKDVIHGSRLRALAGRFNNVKEAAEKLTDDLKPSGETLDQSIATGLDNLNAMSTDLKEKYQKVVNLSPSQKTYVLLEHLKEQKQISDKEYATLTYKVENHLLSFEQMIDELRSRTIIEVVEPLNLEVDDFIRDLGAQNPQEWAGFTQDLRITRKGLADMTAKPVKSFIPAATILAVGLVIVIAIVMIPPNLPAITKGISGTSGAGLKMPWDMIQQPAHFIISLMFMVSDLLLGI